MTIAPFLSPFKGGYSLFCCFRVESELSAFTDVWTVQISQWHNRNDNPDKYIFRIMTENTRGLVMVYDKICIRFCTVQRVWNSETPSCVKIYPGMTYVKMYGVYIQCNFVRCSFVDNFELDNKVTKKTINYFPYYSRRPKTKKYFILISAKFYLRTFLAIREPCNIRQHMKINQMRSFGCTKTIKIIFQ